jgi:hypothetical protein
MWWRLPITITAAAATSGPVEQPQDSTKRPDRPEASAPGCPAGLTRTVLAVPSRPGRDLGRSDLHATQRWVVPAVPVTRDHLDQNEMPLAAGGVSYEHGTALTGAPLCRERDGARRPQRAYATIARVMRIGPERLVCAYHYAFGDGASKGVAASVPS